MCDIIVELLSRDRWRIVRNVAATVDEILRLEQPLVEERWLRNDGGMRAQFFRDAR